MAVVMTSPRCIRPGTTWLVTRRTTRRHFLLRPDRDGAFQNLYWYVTALLAPRFGIELHAVQVLCNHMHEVLTDTRGVLPRFLEQRNRLLANAIKCLHGWPEEVFARKETSCVALCGADAIEKEIIYTLSNCVSAGLVQSPEEWRGPTVSVDDIGKRVVRAHRPSVYFDAKNPGWPAQVQMEVTMPQLLVRTHGSVGRVRTRLSRMLSEAVEAARLGLRRAGRMVRGMRRVFATAHTVRASAWEKYGRRYPHFAAAGNAQEAGQAVRERRTFLQKYREAFRAFQDGVREVLFPLGTWRMRRDAAVLVASQ